MYYRDGMYCCIRWRLRAASSLAVYLIRHMSLLLNPGVRQHATRIMRCNSLIFIALLEPGCSRSCGCGTLSLLHLDACCSCRNAAGILIVYDMTDRSSFERALRWLDELPNTMPSDAVLILVGALLLTGTRVLGRRRSHLV